MSEDLRRRVRAALQARPRGPVEVPGARAAAVLIPLVGPVPPRLLFTVRTETLPSHAGQISFPGGSIDRGDASPVAAALREAHEEIGLEPSAVEILGELEALPTFVSGYVVTPVVGWIERSPRLRPNPAEVASILEVPLDALDDTIRADAGFVHGGRRFPTEAWIYDGHPIWGFTARILRLFLGVLADVGVVRPPAEPAPERA